MAIKIRISLIWFVYAFIVIFIGELIMLRYWKSKLQMHINNSSQKKIHVAYLVFNIIIELFGHAAIITLNFFSWYLLFKYNR